MSNLAPRRLAARMQGSRQRSFMLDARCLNGNFYSELPITMESTDRPREMRGKLGRGGVPLHLRTVNGGIRLIVLRSSV